MKRSIILLSILLIAAAAAAQDDIDRHRDCAYCGMDRKAYGYSRMLLRYADGTETGVCSLHCAVMDLAANDAKRAATILVADRTTRELIDALTALWVVGGAKRGVMTERPKWAFGARKDADLFIANYGGSVVSWEQALAAARSEVARP